MYSSVKSTDLPLGLFSTDVFWNHSCLPVFIIVAFLENATIGYSLESLCVCVCVCVCLCVCVCFCTITQKEIDLETGNRNTL